MKNARNVVLCTRDAKQPVDCFIREMIEKARASGLPAFAAIDSDSNYEVGAVPVMVFADSDPAEILKHYREQRAFLRDATKRIGALSMFAQ